MTTLFYTNADFLLKFYERCIVEGIESEEAKLELLAEMAVDNPGQCSISSTERSKEQVIKDMTKTYGKVLYIDPNKKDTLL